jgi:hypothetical protein
MKKTVSFLLCVIMMISVIPISAFAEDPVYFWEFEGSVEGFGANNSTKEAVGGNLVQTITKSNTWLLSPNNLAINADSCPILKVRVKNSTNRVGHFAIEAIGTEKAAFTGNFINIGEIKNDGEFHEYEVDLSAMAPSEWRGIVTRFRLRLSQWTCEGTIEVDYIRIFQATSEGGETAPREGATVRFESNVPLSSLVVYQGAQYSGAVAKAESDGTYKLPAGLYTYTATSTDS